MCCTNDVKLVITIRNIFSGIIKTKYYQLKEDLWLFPIASNSKQTIPFLVFFMMDMSLYPDDIVSLCHCHHITSYCYYILLYPDDIVSVCQCHHITLPSWMSLNPYECQDFIFNKFSLSHWREVLICSSGEEFFFATPLYKHSNLLILNILVFTTPFARSFHLLVWRRNFFLYPPK